MATATTKKERSFGGKDDDGGPQSVCVCMSETTPTEWLEFSSSPSTFACFSHRSIPFQLVLRFFSIASDLYIEGRRNIFRAFRSTALQEIGPAPTIPPSPILERFSFFFTFGSPSQCFFGALLVAPTLAEIPLHPFFFDATNVAYIKQEKSGGNLKSEKLQV